MLRTIKNPFCVAVLMVLIALVVGVYDALGQSKTARIYAPCPGSTAQAEVKINRTGDVQVVPCPTKRFLLGSSEIGSGGIVDGGITPNLPTSIFTNGSLTNLGGTLTATLKSQPANQIFAAPNGAAGVPAFRALIAADFPILPQSQITNLVADLLSKQPFLVSGTNIKTINGASILGSGDITIAGGGGGGSIITGTSNTGFLPFFNAEGTITKSQVQAPNQNELYFFPGDSNLQVVADRNLRTFSIARGGGVNRFFDVNLTTNEITANLPSGTLNLGDTLGTGNQTVFTVNDAARTITLNAANGTTHTGLFQSSRFRTPVGADLPTVNILQGEFFTRTTGRLYHSGSTTAFEEIPKANTQGSTANQFLKINSSNNGWLTTTLTQGSGINISYDDTARTTTISATGGGGSAPSFTNSGTSILMPQYAFGDSTLQAAANTVYLTRLKLDVATAIDEIAFRQLGTDGANFLGFGVYSIDGATRYATTGAVSTDTENTRSAPLTAVTLAAGEYWVAYTTNSATINIRSTSFTSAQQQLVYNFEPTNASAASVSAWVAVAANPSVAGVLPATLGAISTPSVGQEMPIIKLFKK